MGARPPLDEIATEFETLRTPTDAEDGRPVCRGTHQHDDATVERSYHCGTEGLLTVETAYLDGTETVDVRTQCWLLVDGHLRHTGEDIVDFCRTHHSSDPATDVARCYDDSPEVSELADVTSTFQPATSVTVEDGAALRYTGTHEAGDDRVERRFYAGEDLRIETAFFVADERLGSLTERQELLEDGEFVAATGEPVDAFCRRTHLSEPEADLRYCRRLAEAPAGAPPERR